MRLDHTEGRDQCESQTHLLDISRTFTESSADRWEEAPEA